MDVPTYVLIEPPSSWSWSPKELCRGPEATQASSNVELLEEDGWQLQPLQRKRGRGFIRERKELASSVVPFTLPAGFSTLTTWRKPSDVPGALTGASANIADTGDPYIKKKRGAGQSFDDATLFQLAGGLDQASFTSPDTADDTIAMDRIGISPANHDPSEGFFLNITFSGGRKAASDKATANLFTGPAGVDLAFTGFGQYALEEGGDGILILWERGLPVGSTTISWVQRGATRYCTAQTAMVGTHQLYIRPVAYSSPRGSVSGRIYIYGQAQERTVGAPSRGDAFQTTGAFALLWIYSAPATGKAKPAIHIAPHRIDIRRNARHEIQIVKSCYPNTGVLWTDVFSADSYLLSTKPLRCYWYASGIGTAALPTGCSIDLDVYDALTGVALTAEGTSGTITDAFGRIIGYYKYFNIAYPQRQFKGKFTFHGNADLNPSNTTHTGAQSSKTAILVGLDVLKDGRVDDLTPQEVTTKVMDVSGTGQDKDPSHETAGAVAKDLAGTLGLLSYRATIPYILETKCPDIYGGHFGANPVSVISSGWLQKALAKRRGSKIPKGLGSTLFRTSPSLDWKAYSLQFLGEWIRPSAARMPFRWDFRRPSDKDQPALATNLIKDGLAFAGYIPEQIDVPAKAVRMFNPDDPEDKLDPLLDIWPFLLHIAFDYLGCWMCFDRNAAIPGSGVDRGIWRLRDQNTMDGPVLAHFHLDGATDANKLAAFAPVHAQSAYKIETVSGQQTQHSYALKGSLETYVRSPEANLVCVTGTGNCLFGTGRAAEEQLTVTMANPRSYNFAGLAPSHPKYPPSTDNPDYLPFIVPLLYPDRNIKTIEGIEWVAAHIYERVAHGGKCVVFQAPLLKVWDSTDTYQVRPRPLRFYDLVKVNGVKFFVRNVAYRYRKDRAQWAVYELELPNGVLY